MGNIKRYQSPPDEGGGRHLIGINRQKVVTDRPLLIDFQHPQQRTRRTPNSTNVTQEQHLHPLRWYGPRF